MSEITPKNNAHCSIPDDPEQSINRFIVVAAKHVRQLQGVSQVLPADFIQQEGDHYSHGRSAARLDQV